MGAIIGTIVTNLVGEAIKDKIAGNMPASDPAKGIVQSKTMWGLAIAALAPWLMRKTGLDIGEFQSVVDSIVVLFGVVMAWWGRKTASRSMG